MRSMEILSEIDGLRETIYQNQEDINSFKFYWYLKWISANQKDILKIDDHFSPNLSIKYKELSLISSAKPVHMP